MTLSRSLTFWLIDAGLACYSYQTALFQAQQWKRLFSKYSFCAQIPDDHGWKQYFPDMTLEPYLMLVPSHEFHNEDCTMKMTWQSVWDDRMTRLHFFFGLLFFILFYSLVFKIGYSQFQQSVEGRLGFRLAKHIAMLTIKLCICNLFLVYKGYDDVLMANFGYPGFDGFYLLLVILVFLYDCCPLCWQSSIDWINALDRISFRRRSDMEIAVDFVCDPRLWVLCFVSFGIFYRVPISTYENLSYFLNACKDVLQFECNACEELQETTNLIFYMLWFSVSMFDIFAHNCEVDPASSAAAEPLLQV